MMKRLSLVLALSAMALLSACADEKVTPQKSPCAGLEGSPCGPKRAVNTQVDELV